MFNQVQHAVGVSRFVVIPRDKLDKVFRQGDSSLLVKDGRVGVTNEIRRDNILTLVSQNTLHLSVTGILKGLADSLVRSTILELGSQVNNLHIGGRDTEGHTGELSVEGRDDLTDSLGGSSRGRNDVIARSASSTPVLLGRSVDSLLSGSDSMDSGHESLIDSKLVVNDLGEWGQAVGSARCVGDNIHGWVVFLSVDAHHKHGGVAGWSRDNNLLGTALHVKGGLFDGSESTGGLDDVVGSSITPLDVGRIHLAKDLDGLSVDQQGVGLSIVTDFLSGSSVDSVVLVHVLHVSDRDERVVDSNNLNVRLIGSGSHYETVVEEGACVSGMCEVLTGDETRTRFKTVATRREQHCCVIRNPSPPVHYANPSGVVDLELCSVSPMQPSPLQ